MSALTVALAGALIGPPALARGPQDGSELLAVRQMRDQEIHSCRSGEAQVWADGRDRPALPGGVRLAYRHGDAPAWFSHAQVLAAVQSAAVGWGACGVPVQVLTLADGEPTPEGAVLVHWPAEAGSAHFGLANLTRRSLTLGRGAFEMLRQRNPAYPAQDVLQMVISHEMGHFFGLMAHSRRCVDVMSYYTDGQGGHCFTRDGGSHRRLPEYRALLPTACDIQRCRAANGLSPSNRLADALGR